MKIVYVDWKLNIESFECFLCDASYQLHDPTTTSSLPPHVNRIWITSTKRFDYFSHCSTRRLTEIMSAFFLIDFFIVRVLAALSHSLPSSREKFTYHDCIIWQFSLSLCSHIYSTCLILYILLSMYIFFVHSSPVSAAFFALISCFLCPHHSKHVWSLRVHTKNKNYENNTNVAYHVRSDWERESTHNKPKKIDIYWRGRESAE